MSWSMIAAFLHAWSLYNLCYCAGLILAGCHVPCTKATLLLCFSAERGEWIQQNAHGLCDKGREDHSPDAVMDKTVSTWIYSQSNQSRIMRKENQTLKAPSLCISLLPGLNLTVEFSPSSSSAAYRYKEGGLWSVYHMLSLLLFPPQAFLLWLQDGVSPMWHNLSGADCSSMGFPQGQPFFGHWPLPVWGCRWVFSSRGLPWAVEVSAVAPEAFILPSSLIFLSVELLLSHISLLS